MAGFKTHITFSSTLGVGYAAGGYFLFDIPWPSAVLAGGLCGVAGMLPDLDSGSGRPIRESMAFAAAAVPMLLVDRFEHLGMSKEMMVLAGAAIYFLIRFGAAKALSKYTVHRGMLHSIPAALIAAIIGFMLCGCTDYDIRLYKGGAVFAGFMSHLLLDEIYSIEWHRGKIRLKKSFGTAIKFWSGNMWANVSTYGKLIALGLILAGDLTVMPNVYQPHIAHADHDATTDAAATKDDDHAHPSSKETTEKVTDAVNTTRDHLRKAADKVLDRFWR